MAQGQFPFKSPPQASEVIAWPTDQLRAVVASTRDDGMFAAHVKAAREELTRRAKSPA